MEASQEPARDRVDEIIIKITEFLTEYNEFEIKIEPIISQDSVKHFLFRIFIIFYYNIKALNFDKAKNFYEKKVTSFEAGGRYYLENNEPLLSHITDCENKSMTHRIHWPTDFYAEIYEKI